MTPHDPHAPVPPAPPAPEPATIVHEPPPRGAGLMNGVRWALFAGLLALAAFAIGGHFFGRSGHAPAKASAGHSIYFCPMHPSYVSDRPGECPICGMKLELKPAAASGPAAARSGDVPGLTEVELSPERIQMIGVRWARVERRPMGGTLDLVGFVAPDESRLHAVQLRVAGWVQRLYVDRAGETVRAGQPLLSIYSPELFQTEQELLIESGAQARAGMAHGPDEVESVRQRLRLLGVSDAEIERLEREKKPTREITLRAPVTGTVLEKSVAPGQYVNADSPLFTVADLRRLWVLADVYEMDLGRARAGNRAIFTSDAYPGRTFEGRIDLVAPTVSSETRTLQLRMPIANADGALKPGMYGHVRLAAPGSEALVVPSEAVVNAGDQRYVFLSHPGGRFEPRRITVGVQDGDWVQVLHGVAAGDTVVASASFLIDSESRLEAAIAGMGREPAAPRGR